MQVFARYELAADRADAAEPALLLEGAWPKSAAGAARWSLDETIDDRCRWIDRAAAELAERLGKQPGNPFAAGGPQRDAGQAGIGGAAEAEDAGGEITFAYLNALALRYYFVKLLRIVAFFDQTRRPAASAPICLHVAEGRDEDYVDLFAALARAHDLELETVWRAGADSAAPAAAESRAWRRWAAQADDLLPAIAAAETNDRVVVCGNPHLLDPVCAALLARGCRVWWLYERFAVRSWWRWRKAGVGQLVCEASADRGCRFNDGGPAGKLVVRGVDLAAPVERWLCRQAALDGARQSRLVANIDEHFRTVQPTALVLDEDATPLKRAAVALAKRHQARSLIVQHGAPCGPFGFVPQAADRLCVWGASSREQLLHFGAAAQRICVTGWPQVETRLAEDRQPPPQRRRIVKRILLLATLPPDDGRPDTVSFHLTRQTHEQMLNMACAAVGRLPRARLTIKLHPRCSDDAVFRRALDRHPALKAEIVRKAKLERLFAASDCVLSCASTAGIEAALAGAPVVQLLPAGSGDILPADRWGLLGSARQPAELEALLGRALARGWRMPQHEPQNLASICSRDPHRSAADRIADVLLETDLATAAPTAADSRVC